MCPERFSEVCWGNHWHKILFSCAETELIPSPVLQSWWRSTRQRKKCACVLHHSVGPWLTSHWSGCRAVFLPALLCAGSALRCTRAQQGWEWLPGQEGQAQQIGCEPICPCCVPGRAGSLGAEGSSALPGCVSVGAHGVLMPVLCSYTALVKWIEKSLLMLQFRWVLPLWAFGLVFYSLKDPRISNSNIPLCSWTSPSGTSSVVSSPGCWYCMPGKVNTCLGEGQGKGTLPWFSRKTAVSRNPVKP